MYRCAKIPLKIIIVKAASHKNIPSFLNSVWRWFTHHNYSFSFCLVIFSRSAMYLCTWTDSEWSYNPQKSEFWSDRWSFYTASTVKRYNNHWCSLLQKITRQYWEVIYIHGVYSNLQSEIHQLLCNFFLKKENSPLSN